MGWLWERATATAGALCSHSTRTVGTQCSQSTGAVGTQCSQSIRTAAAQCFQPSLESAARMMGEQKYDEAYGIAMEYIKVLELAKAFSLLAECAYELGRYDEVPDLVAASIVHLGPKQEHVLHLAGLAFLKMDRCEEAYLSLRRALKLRPTCSKIHGALKDVAEKMQAQSQETDVPYLWQYQEQDGSWSDMPLALCQELENAFANSQANPQSAFVKMHGREFDFGTMRQRNIASGRWRSVRRQCVAAMVKASSITAQVLHTCLSQTVASRQATAAAEDVRKELASQLHFIRKQKDFLLKKEALMKKQEAFLVQRLEHVREREALVEAAPFRSQRQRIYEEAKIRTAEFPRGMRDFKTVTAALSLEVPAGKLHSVIFGQRQEIEFWRSRQECHDRVLLNRFGFSRVMFLDDCTLLAPMQRLLCGAAGPHNGPFLSGMNRCQQMSKVNVLRVLRVVNPMLWNEYRDRKVLMQGDQIQGLQKTWEMKLLERIAFEVDHKNDKFGATYWICCDETVNEILLFHGTSASNAESIATDGFDISRVRRGLYGNGFYFSCEACKSFQYSMPAPEIGHCIIVARVLLGSPRFARGPINGGKEVLASNEDSVVVLPQNVSGQFHHEFVVFDSKQIFPEFIVYFN